MQQQLNKSQSQPTLKQYTTMAKRIIIKICAKYGPNLGNRILKDDEAIGNVVSAIIDADMKWNPNYVRKNGKPGNCKLGTYRMRRAKYVIFNYIKNHQMKSRTLSLDARLPGAVGDGVHDTFVKDVIQDKTQLAPDEILENKENNAISANELRSIFSCDTVTPRDKRVLERYYINDETLQEIADDLKLTKQCISLIIRKTIKRVRKYLNVN